jgi:diguanylate cyclase (GGDEF)-like protein/PAS domain S-box-containing protein
VIRTTLAILALAMVLGLTFASLVSASVDRREQQRAEIRLQELLSTAEKTAQIACFLKNRPLAAEIAQGLMSDHTVSGVSITSGDILLSQVGNSTSGHGNATDSSLIVRQIYSPVDAHDPVGKVSLFVDRAAIHAEASSYSLASTLALAGQAALVAAAVAVAVYVFSTRPMKAVSNELHRIHFDTGARLHVPVGNRFDEIGTLVTDVNALIASREDLLTTERELRIAHELAERKMRLIFEKADTGLFVLDDRGILESWNPAFVRLLHLTPEQLPLSGVTHLQQLLAPGAARLNELIGQCLTTGRSNDLDLEIAINGNPCARWIEVAIKPIDATTLQGVVNDITVRKHGELSAQEEADQDALTGLLNRRGMNRHFGREFSLHPGLAIMQIDLDHFKKVNDAYGHQRGDQVLRHVAEILRGNTRRGDPIARHGGDEFAIALVAIANPYKAEEIARAIIDEINRPIDIGGNCVHIGASIGIALASPGESLETVMRRADAAMYTAKKAGRGQVSLASVSVLPQTSAVA